MSIFQNNNNAPTTWIISHVVVTPAPSGGPSIGGPPNGGAPPPTDGRNVVNIVPLVTVLCSVGVIFLVSLILGLIIAFRCNKDDPDDEQGVGSQANAGGTEKSRYRRKSQNVLTSIRITDVKSTHASQTASSDSTTETGSPQAATYAARAASGGRRSPQRAGDEAPAVVRTLSNQSPTNHAEAPNAMYTPYEANPVKGNAGAQFEKWLASPTAATKSITLTPEQEAAMGAEHEVTVIVADDQVEAQTLPDRPEASLVSRGLNKRTLNGVLI